MTVQQRDHSVMRNSPSDVGAQSNAPRMEARLLPHGNERRAQTKLEMVVGREAAQRYASNCTARPRLKTNKQLGVLAPEELPCDPTVSLPPDVRETIARGKEAFENQRTHRPSANRLTPKVITAVVDETLQHRRDVNLLAREVPPNAGRRQPPMLARLRAVTTVVDRLVADGMPFRVGPNSQMNRAVREWLNEKAARSVDPRKSRHKQISPTAVRELLRQVRAEGRATPRRVALRRRTMQEEARERLRELRTRCPTVED